MSVAVYFHKNSEKSINKLPKYIQRKLFSVINDLKKNPLAGIPLRGELKGARKYRLGDYRIVYQYFPKVKEIIIYKVESRQGIYKN